MKTRILLIILTIILTTASANAGEPFKIPGTYKAIGVLDSKTEEFRDVGYMLYKFKDHGICTIAIEDGVTDSYYKYEDGTISFKVTSPEGKTEWLELFSVFIFEDIPDHYLFLDKHTGLAYVMQKIS